MEKRYKAILLVLASDNNELYRKFKEIYRQYYKSHPDVLVLFTYGRAPDLDKDDHDLVFDIEENYYPGMIDKTLRALEYIEKTYDYDFLIRTNLSTFWILDRLVNRLSSLQTNEYFAGSIRWCSIKGGGRSPDYIAGVNLVLSRDMVQKMLVYKDQMLSWSTLSEDWAMSQALREQGHIPKAIVPAPLHHLDTFTEIDDRLMCEIELADKRNRDHFRIKNKGDRKDLDISIANLLLGRYYGKTIL